jgi:hypothetical protein
MTHSADTSFGGRRWELPPLILHPFGGAVDAAASLDSIKLSLYKTGMGEPGLEKEPLLRARHAEFRMLCLAGKDIMRWVAQCVDFTVREPALAKCGIEPQSFADLLANHTPAGVVDRFRNWGVADYRRILSRAIGVNAIFAAPPEWGAVTCEFLENYYVYADVLFACFQNLTAFTALDPTSFDFELYTSDEYFAKLGCTQE